MFLKEFCEACEIKPGAVEDHPWGETVFKVGGKVFCFVGESSVTVKCTPDDQAALVQDPAVTIAPYVGRFGWVRVAVSDEQTLALALELIDGSYKQVLAKLPRSARPQC